ncbi:MAG: hypothetical protein ACYDCO_26010 [Armatimonadota bacterium]
MKPLSFQTSHEDTYTYRFISDEEGILVKRWAGWEDIGLWIDFEVDDPHWIRFNVSGTLSNRIDELALYLGLIWRLSKGLHRNGIPTYYRDYAAERLGKPFEFVNWEYKTEAWSADLDGQPVTHFEDHKFVPARSITGTRLSLTWAIVHQAGLFDLSSFQALADMQKETLNDASSEINLFCLNDGRKEMLLEELRRETPPDLSDFLQPGELFIDLLVGVDMGYLDAITVKSPVDISEQIDSLLADFHAAIQEYEEQIAKIGPADTVGYTKMLAKLALHPDMVE